jgi:NAD(P)-dependent dehydrogenase (short-subunit alcohol dehydrogenase family)
MNNNLFDLSGRVALVTGGSKGLGKAMARAFAESGADVVISSRHEADLKQALDEILEGTGRRGIFVVADMARRDDVGRLTQTAIDQMSQVDILVNNAGTNVPGAIDQIRDTDWDRIVEINLTSCMALTRSLVPQMKERRWGRVIHISSIMGLGSKDERNVYSATKSGLIGLTRASALDLGPFGITVNAIAPGPFLTDLPSSILTKEQQEQLAQCTALGRWGDPREMAGPTLLLASEAGSYITGATLVVDGGALCRIF